MKYLFTFLLFTHLTAFAQPEISWENSFGGTYTDKGVDIIEVENGNYLVLNMPYSNNGDVLNSHGGADFWLLKLDASGALIWQKCYGGTGDDEAQGIIPTQDGNFLLIGQTNSKDGDVTSNHGQTDAWIIKIDPNGDVIWKKTYGGTKYDAALSITPAHGGGYLISGMSASNDYDVPNNNHGDVDLWAFRINEEGELMWGKLYGGNNWDSSNSVFATDDGGYIFAGSSSSTNTGDVFGNHGGSDSWILKIDSTGTKQWKSVLGGTDNDYCSGIVKADDGGYLVFNYCASIGGLFSDNHGGFDFWVYKLSATGTFAWQKFYGGTAWELGSGIQKLSDGNCILLGQAQSTDGDLVGNLNPSAWMVCINQEGEIIWKKTYGGSQSDTFVNLVASNDGAITVVGHSTSNDGDVQSGGGPQNAGDTWVVRFKSKVAVKNPNAERFNLTIIPNPASNYIEITANEDFNEGMISIFAQDASTVMTRSIHAGQRIDVSHLAVGNYLIKLELEGKVEYARLVKF